MQPTGDVHLGSYLGALRNWVSGQHQCDAFHGIVDLHALTVIDEPDVIGKLTVELAAMFFAIGLDPDVATVFVQSHVPEHNQLGWIMECTVSYGELSRMTEFKDKSSKREAQFISAGLFTYPACRPPTSCCTTRTRCPVGDDQRQHVEITRDAAIRFNHRFGETFVVPEAVTPAVGARDEPAGPDVEDVEVGHVRRRLRLPDRRAGRPDEEVQAGGHRFRTGPDAVRYDRPPRSPAWRTCWRSMLRSPAGRCRPSPRSTSSTVASRSTPARPFSPRT